MLEKETCLLHSGWEREWELCVIRAVLNHLAEVVIKTKISEKGNEEETDVV